MAVRRNSNYIGSQLQTQQLGVSTTPDASVAEVIQDLSLQIQTSSSPSAGGPSKAPSIPNNATFGWNQPSSTTSTTNVYSDEQVQQKGGFVSTSYKKIWSQIEEKIGHVHDDRLVFPSLYNQDEPDGVPRLFSSLEYSKCEQEGRVNGVLHASGSVLGAAALVAGTTVGAGILALPTATAAAGFLPSSAAMVVAWVYMTFSGLLIAELTLNRLGETGRPGLGLLELYHSYLSKPLSRLGSAAYFFLHYAVMVAYVAQGGVTVDSVLTSIGLDGLVTSIPGIGQAAFALVCGVSLFSLRPSAMEEINNWLVLGVAATFLSVIGIGAGTADLSALVDATNQHPEQVVNCFPIIFLALVYQNVVPTIVTQLEGDRTKITQAIVGGTAAPLLMFLAWNAVVLGNVLGAASGNVDLSTLDPLAALQNSAVAGAALGPLVSAFSTLALLTSVIGFTYGLLDAWTDVLKIDSSASTSSISASRSNSENDYSKWKLPLFALIFGPSLAMSVADPDIFFKALEYGGAFGVSTLFLVLPPIMVWNERYGQNQKPLFTKPMVPFGKLSLGSMWKAAGTLILEQGAEKLGVFDFIHDHIQLPS